MSKLDTRKKALHTAEKQAVNRIVAWVVGIVITVLVIVAFMGYRYVHRALGAVDANDKQSVTVTIPNGATTKAIGTRLEKKGVIKSALVFNYYVKFHNVSNFQAGDYSLTKAESLPAIIRVLRGGSATSDSAGTVLVKEGVTAETVADSVDQLKTKDSQYTKANFLKLLKDEAFFDQLNKKYPRLLKSAKAAKGVRYRLEGYLFPATYTVTKGESLKALITAMVAKTDSVMQNYYGSLGKQGYSVQEVLTLASLVEREGVSATDRRTIAGVFLNRIDAGMPLQSDISVMYALNTHKTHLTNKDTSVDSPYNLYVHTGYGPGPFNSPSETAIRAVLSPKERDRGYLYFVANLKTGEILYATTLAQHEQNTAKFSADNGN
ncbi:MAG: endolytic transglycosylase MltG [Lactobacillus sp.]|nr:endolytic transglycosylase MltG [Lactobacillus sp.]MCI2032209.1 endolytic transglycosylase MltG [Lactobacillus sp.]